MKPNLLLSSTAIYPRLAPDSLQQEQECSAPLGALKLWYVEWKRKISNQTVDFSLLYFVKTNRNKIKRSLPSWLEHVELNYCSLTRYQLPLHFSVEVELRCTHLHVSPPDALLLRHLVHGLTVLSFLLYVNFLSHRLDSTHGIHSIWGALIDVLKIRLMSHWKQSSNS